MFIRGQAIRYDHTCLHVDPHTLWPHMFTSRRFILYDHTCLHVDTHTLWPHMFTRGCLQEVRSVHSKRTNINTGISGILLINSGRIVLWLKKKCNSKKKSSIVVYVYCCYDLPVLSCTEDCNTRGSPPFQHSFFRKEVMVRWRCLPVWGPVNAWLLSA